MRRTLPRAASALCVLLVMFATIPRAFAEDSFLSGKPFSLEQVRESLGAIFERRLIQAVRNRGVAFPPSPENLGALKGAGASEALLDAVAHADRRQTAGPLSLACAPAECSVAINGKGFGETKGGQLTAPEAPAGDVTVEFHKDGYTGQTVRLALPPGAPGAAAVRLERRPDSRENFAALLLQRMAAKMAAGEPGETPIGGSGRMLLRGGVEAVSAWAAAFRIDGDNLGLNFHAGAVDLAFAAAGPECAVKSTSAANPAGGEMASWARLFCLSHPALVARRLVAAGIVPDVEGPRPSASAEWIVRARSRAESYELVLGADLLPASLTWKGAGAETVQALYGNYSTLEPRPGARQTPRRIVIRPAGGGAREAEFLVDAVSPVEGTPMQR